MFDLESCQCTMMMMKAASTQEIFHGVIFVMFDLIAACIL